MTMVSKYPLNKDIEARVYELFFNTLADLRTAGDISGFLEEFLTPTEKVMLAKRLSIAVLLAKEYDFRSVCKILKVGFNTVSNVNLWMKHHKGVLNKVIVKILNDEKNQEFWDKVEYFLGKIIVPMKGTNWSQRRKEVEIERVKRRKPF